MNEDLTRYHNSLLKAVSKATYEAMATPVAFVIVYAEPAGDGTTMFHYKASTIGQYFREKAECMADALIEGVNKAVVKCFEAVPADDYKVYHA